VENNQPRYNPSSQRGYPNYQEEETPWYQETWFIVLASCIVLYLVLSSSSATSFLGINGLGSSNMQDTQDYVDTAADEVDDIDLDNSGGEGDVVVIDTEGLTVA
jgi:hypothetical protein